MTDVPFRDLAVSYGAFVVAYLLGSLSFAVIVSKLLRMPDPRTYGSGNPGATNVLRSGNKLAAALTLLFDALKGFVPVVLAKRYALTYNFEDTTIAFVGVAAFIGHLFPVFFRFKGGKGVATAAGVLLGYEWGLGLATMAVWVMIALVFRYSSLAAILAAVFAPFCTLMFYDGRPALALAVSIMGLGLLWRHWKNIVRLLTGKEPRIGEKPPERGGGGGHGGGGSSGGGSSGRKRRRRAHRLHTESRGMVRGGHGSFEPTQFHPYESPQQHKGN